MLFKHDTICALSTPPGISGIAVIRISGKEAIKTADKIFRGNINLSKARSRQLNFGRILADDQIIDEVMITVFREPKSYTGEDLVEISCHGSMFIINRVIKLLLKNIRLAEPGEFTQRAFLNNKLGLTQAEAIGDLLNSQTQYSHLVAMQQLEGTLRKKIENLLEKLTDIRTKIELEIDFLEQRLEQLDNRKLIPELDELHSQLMDLVNSGEEGIILRDGLRLSLVGAPNVGKSSIFNAFLKTERAIVTPHPGTTRDYLEEIISLKGYLVKIYDTAGIRETNDQIEKIGIERSYSIIKESHKVIFIIDGNENLREYRQLKQLIPEEKIIKVINKSDKLDKKELNFYKVKGYVACSAKLKDGLNCLKQSILKEILIDPETVKSGILSNTRQVSAAKRAAKSVSKAIKSIQNNLGYEFTAFDLKEASSALEEIIGKITDDDILNRIFENFCIGK